MLVRVGLLIVIITLTVAEARRHRFQTNFKGGGGKGLAKGSVSRRSGLAGEERKDGKGESGERHERSFDQGSSDEQSKYGSPSGADEGNVDLHNKEFCVDVSTYEPVEWVEEEAETCETVFVKECNEKTEEVCQEVSETRCQVVPYTECSLGMEAQPFTSSLLAPKLFVEKVCSQGKKVIPHVKMLPECKNVTKQNCVTLWETDDDGKQVWAGNEACEPVTWQECKLVPKNVKFIVPEINCTDGNELWYHEPEVVEDVRMTNTFTCEVKSTTSCETQSRPDCKSISWEECNEVPVTNCQPKMVHKPVQELLHRKKCLLADDPELAAAPADDGYGEPQAPPVTEAPLPTYSG